MSAEQVMKTDVFKRTRPEQCASLDQRKRAKELFAQGRGYTFVAKETGVSMHTVRDWGRRYRRGKFTEDIAQHLYRYDSQAHDKVCELRAQGLSLRAIAAQTGVSVSTCREWIERRKAEELEKEKAQNAESEELLSI